MTEQIKSALSKLERNKLPKGDVFNSQINASMNSQLNTAIIGAPDESPTSTPSQDAIADNANFDPNAPLQFTPDNMVRTATGLRPATQAEITAAGRTFVPSSTGVSFGTEGIRDVNAENDSQLQDNINGAAGGTDLPTGSVLADLQGSLANIQRTTKADLDNIDRAGVAAGKAFDEQVKRAEESRRKELPTAIVRAGEAGGFENTQLAGAAALLPTDPKTGEPFVGAGGRLSDKRQLLDKNISFIKAEQQRAISAARAAERKYQKTRKREDYNDALGLAKFANDLKQEEENMKIKREELDLRKDANERAENREGRLDAGEDRAEEIMTQKRAEFAQKNQDRIVEAFASALLDLDDNNEIIFPTFEQIQELANQNEVPVALMTAAINERADELNKTAKANRATQLNKEKFDETKSQNDIKNEMEKQRIVISAGNLALSRRKYQDKEEFAGLPDKFFSAARSNVEGLKKGEEWGTVFDRMKLQFPEVDDTKIDSVLGEEWKEGGAFEDFKSKQYKEPEPKEFEKQADIWKWLATDEAENLTNTDKKKQIKGAGMNPEDFGIY